MKYYIKAISNYINFEGRATRSEYWYYVLFNFIISIITSLISRDLNQIYGLAVLLPGLAVAVRRMHDIGKSGWYILIPLYSLYLLCQESNVGDNEYGPESINED